MHTRKKVIIIVVVLLLVLLLVAFFAIGSYFFQFALQPRRNERAPGVPEGEVAGTSDLPDTYAASREWFATHAEDINITSYDGLSLHGWLAQNEGHRYAIVVHGYTGDGASMAAFGEKFYERGFSVLQVECRGHGASEGNYIGMGWHDRLDMLTWIDTLIARDAQAEIMLFGISMGGATVMMTAGEPLPPNVKLVIEDCGYSSVWDEFTVQLKAMFNLPPFPVMQAASVVTKLRAGYWLGEADAVAQVAKSTVPILFIHGEDDTFVPYWMLEPLYNAKTGEKAKFTVPGAGHGGAASTDPEGYWNAVDAFIADHM